MIQVDPAIVELRQNAGDWQHARGGDHQLHRQRYPEQPQPNQAPQPNGIALAPQPAGQGEHVLLLETIRNALRWFVHNTCLGLAVITEHARCARLFAAPSSAPVPGPA